MQRQLTTAAHGHVLTNTAVWSPDSQWIVYDTRSDAAGSVFDGTRIDRVHVATGEVQLLYESRRGAHCGVATCSPVDDRVAFILGPEDPTSDWQYSPCHRRGVIVDAQRPGEITNLDARDLTPPFTPGALRGGSHVHTFSPDGSHVAFTYEDHILESLHRGPEPPSTPPAEVHVNQRNVAVAFPLAVRVPRTHPRNHDGEFFSVVVSRTVNAPQPGSDEISRAYEDAWLGGGPPRRLAFLGDCVSPSGAPLTELFILELPDDLTQPGDEQLAGTATRRPAPPHGTRQRRLTFTADRAFPGVAGPRHWPRSSPDGEHIGFLMRDDQGVPQLWTISPAGGAPRQLTHDPFPVASAFTWNARGTHIAYAADNSVMAVDAADGRTRRLTPRTDDAAAPRPEACVFSPDGNHIALVRRVPAPQGAYNQIFVVEARV